MAAGERNVKIAQAFLEEETELLESHRESISTLMKTLTEQSRKQREVWGCRKRRLIEASGMYREFFWSGALALHGKERFPHRAGAHQLPDQCPQVRAG